MTVSRIMHGVAVLVATQLFSWANAEDAVLPAGVNPPEDPQAAMTSDEPVHEVAEDQVDIMRAMNHRRRYTAPYVLPQPYHYRVAPYYYPRYLEEQTASQLDDPQIVDTPQKYDDTQPLTNASELSPHHHHRYVPVPYGYYYAPIGYYASPYPVSRPYPRYLKGLHRAAAVDRNAAALSKRSAASKKLRSMGHRRYGYYYYVSSSPYYRSYYGYRSYPYGYVRYLY
ncbi:hypothetical protein BESB_067150 [Besnoitia besnoiti]|uniref:Transmembrane protein n=1 Tax=Besnoitia besnoiti TaxID=94643 RepID=A0A2A9MH02_BESBE|nr:hypothetical protein BESB_067150 [Besnoitia besnoiti]PFH34682.1 hypothetical protein BESB_067150 [Besnoitia besnoiti]